MNETEGGGELVGQNGRGSDVLYTLILLTRAQRHALCLVLFFEDGFGFWAECNGVGVGVGVGGPSLYRSLARAAFDNNLRRPLMLKSRGIRFARK